MKYDPAAIEKKWQAFWKEQKSFKAVEDPSRPKYYVLDMFPYPSGSGLHVGHLVGYTATDVMARYKRQKGFSVLHPMGWDSFGLPAEQYAIRTGTHPAITTHLNIRHFRHQLESMGYAYDWDREIATSEPDYYKWTQWIFTKLYERGLAYQADLLVNYCPALGTVLANEEVEDGHSKEGGHPVERRPLRQWVLKITEYADRLLEDLQLVDWPESLKRHQRNWIGKSEGAHIDFKISQSDKRLTIFTTCPNTLFGVSFITISPEHPLVSTIVIPDRQEAVAQYQREALTKSDLARTELAEEKTGVFTGSYALHPFTNQPLPIFVADYVLMNYGTGAVMGVPAHDERDFAFAQTYQLPITAVVIPDDTSLAKPVAAGMLCYPGEGIATNSDFLNGLHTNEAKRVMIAELEKRGLGKRTHCYRLRDWLFSRQRYWGEPFPLLYLQDGSTRLLGVDELPLQAPELDDFKPTADGKSPLAKVKDWVEIIDPITKQNAHRETNTMPQWAGSCWYYLRFCDPKNQSQAWAPDKERYWMAVDLYVGGAEHAVLHLLYARFWHKVLYDCGLVSTVEPFQRLLNQGLIVARSYKRVGGHYVTADEVVEKEGKYYHWQTQELLESHIEKMSKSKLNGTSPDQVIEMHGADALRLYILFMGPIDKEKIYNSEAVLGCRRFLNRVFEMATSPKVIEKESEEAFRLGYRLVAAVTEDIEKLSFNTAIAKMMEFLNDFTSLAHYPKRVIEMVILVLAPFAPHMAEELWHLVKGEDVAKMSVSEISWPEVDEKYLVDSQATYVIQVNGKVRGKLQVPSHYIQDEVFKLACEDEKVAKYVTATPVKIIFVQNRLLNIVI